MLMLYQFKLEVFDRNYGYSFATDYALVADSNENRVGRIRRLVSGDCSSVLQRCVLVAVRVLALREQRLINKGRTDGFCGTLLWLAAVPVKAERAPVLPPSLCLYTSDELSGITAGSAEHSSAFLLSRNQYVPALSTPISTIAT